MTAVKICDNPCILWFIKKTVTCIPITVFVSAAFRKLLTSSLVADIVPTL